MSLRAFSRKQNAIILTWIAIVSSVVPPAANSAAARSGQVTRKILFWLRRPGNVDDQNFLVRGVRTLRRLRGVSDVRSARSFRAGGVTEQSFDIGGIVIFRVSEALNQFGRDPHWGAAIDAMLRRLVLQYIVYNFVNE